MEYKIRIPKFYGDVIPLYQVAWAMAIAKATAYGTDDFNESVYSVALQEFGKLLMQEVNAGKLKICDRRGFTIRPKAPIWTPNTFDENYCLVSNVDKEVDIDALRRDHPQTEVKQGLFDITNLDLGPSQGNTLTNSLISLHSKLAALNEWGASTGELFSIDENAPPLHERVEIKKVTAPSVAAPERAEPPLWIEKAQEFAQRIGTERWRAGQRQITARSVSGAVAIELAKDTSTHGLQGQRGEGNVRNVGLKGWVFTHPIEAR